MFIGMISLQSNTLTWSLKAEYQIFQWSVCLGTRKRTFLNAGIAEPDQTRFNINSQDSWLSVGFVP